MTQDNYPPYNIHLLLLLLMLALSFVLGPFLPFLASDDTPTHVHVAGLSQVLPICSYQ